MRDVYAMVAHNSAGDFYFLINWKLDIRGPPVGVPANLPKVNIYFYLFISRTQKLRLNYYICYYTKKPTRFVYLAYPKKPEKFGGNDEVRTRNLWRDRPAL